MLVRGVVVATRWMSRCAGKLLSVCEQHSRAANGAYSRAYTIAVSGRTDATDDFIGEVQTIGIQGAGGDQAVGNPIFRLNVESDGEQILPKRAEKPAIRDATEGTEIYLYVFSRGGNGLVGLVNWAGRRGIRIHKVVTIDPHKVFRAKAGFRFKYDNVGEATNYFQNNPSIWAGRKNPFWGRSVDSEFIKVEQHNLTGEGATHLNIVREAF